MPMLLLLQLLMLLLLQLMQEISLCTIHLQAERSSNSTSLFCCYYIAYALFFSNNFECIAHTNKQVFLSVDASSTSMIHDMQRTKATQSQRYSYINTQQAQDHDKIVYIGASHTGSDAKPHGHRKSRAKLACKVRSVCDSTMMMVRYYRQCM